jgi:mono/diheme cytochrome c family protein
MKDGQMFHVLTYGQGNMPSFAAQLSREDRWNVILHVRMLQKPYTPGPVGSRLETVAKLFNQNCAACHGVDGTGANVRNILPLIPDFTSTAWQMSQTEMAIVNQIDYGSAPLMPAWRYKLTREEVLGLAVYIRSFASHVPAGQTPIVPTTHLTARNLYGTFCFTCHDTNGKGNPGIRVSMPELPDFTALTWQKSRKDAELAHSILEGKGKFMLPMKDKLGSIDVKQMVALVRGFEGGKQTVELEGVKLEGPPIPPVPEVPGYVSVDAGELGATTAGLLVSPSGSGPLLGTLALLPVRAVPPATSQTDLTQSAEEAARIRVGANIFRNYCFVCHGNDGTGNLMRHSMPPIPDFTGEAFQKTHTDAQIRVSILDGKGTLMPANRGRITDDQAGSLVAYVRAFGPKSGIPPPRGSDAEFIKAVRELELQLEELHKQLQKTKGKQ